MIDYVSIQSLTSLLLLFVCVGLPIFCVWGHHRYKRQRLTKLSDLWTEKTTDSVIRECLAVYDRITQVQKEILQRAPHYAGLPEMVILSTRLASAATAMTNPPHEIDPLEALAQYESLLAVLKHQEVWLLEMQSDME